MDESAKYYIQNARGSGYSDAEIKQQLLAAGWNTELVDLLLGQMPGSEAPAPSSTDDSTLKEWLKSYFRQYSGQIAALGGVTLVAVVLGLIEPWALKFLIDSVFDSEPAPGPLRDLTGTISLLTIISFLMLGVYIAERLLLLVAARIEKRYSFEFDREVKTRFFGHIIRLPLKYRRKLSKDKYFFDQASAASSDVTRLVIEIPVALFGASMTIFLAFIVMFNINALLAISAFLIIPALYGLTRFFNPQVEASDKEVEKHRDEIKQHVAETVDNMQIVQSFSKEDAQTNKLLDLLDKRFHSLVHQLQVRQGFEFVRGMVVIIGLFTVVYVGGRQIFLNNMTVGELFIFVYYINRFYGPLEVLTNGFNSLRESLGRVQSFYDLLVERTDVDTQTRRGLEFHQFNQAVLFKNVNIVREEQEILKNVNFAVEKGYRIGLTGPDGSGKTTLLEVLPQFTEYEGGSISIDGFEVSEVQTQSMRKQITIINSEPQLFSDSILNNLLYAVDRREKPVESEDVVNAVKAAGALEFIESLPNNYETNLAQVEQFLTPGQKLRISLARAFLRDAPILIIDEPTEELDVQEEKEIIQTLYSLMEGKTVLMASNKLSLLTQMNRVFVIDGGTVINVDKYGGLDKYQSYLSTHELI